MISPERLQNTVQFPEYLKPFIDNLDDLVNINESVYGLRPNIDEQKRDALAKKRTLLIITGFSGAGKDSAVRKLMEIDSRFGLVKTCTTRSTIRPDELEFDPYIRLTEEQFDEALKNGDVIESNGYSGGRYCSLTSKFEDIFDNFEIPILRIDPSGTRFYIDKWKNDKLFFNNTNLITVFIATPSVDVLGERLKKRPGTDSDEVAKRLERVNIDISYLRDAEYIAINETDKLEKMVLNIQKIISS